MSTTSAQPLIRRAAQLAARVHRDERRRDGVPYVEHCREVASILAEAGIDDPELLAAALLHDAMESDHSAAERIALELGDRIATLVGSLSEDEQISDPAERKRELRHRVEAAGEDAITIYGADKLSNARTLRHAWRLRGTEVASEFEMDLPTRIDLWDADAGMVARTLPQLAFVPTLQRELRALRAEVLG